MEPRSLAMAGLVLPLAANAQVMFDTTRVTCADYLAMSPNDARLFSAFISGWFNQKTGHVTVDLNEYERNVANVRSWCATNLVETVFAGLPSAQQAQAANDHQGQLDHELKNHRDRRLACRLVGRAGRRPDYRGYVFDLL